MARKTKGYDNNYRGYSYVHFIKYLLKKKERRKTLSVKFVIDLYEKQDGLCAISGQQMTHTVGQGFVDTNISIDQIVAAEGYTENNVQLVCYKVNQMKGQGDLNNLRSWCAIIASNTK